MSTYTWEFGSGDGSLQFTVVYDTATAKFSVTSQSGSFDLNALWFSNGDGDALDSGGYTLSKSDSSLNMNGANTVWNDDGTASSEKIVWDDYAMVSSTGLGADGTEKSSFVSEGETIDIELAGFDPETFGVLGVRATSVNGTDGIKWVDKAAVESDGINLPPVAKPINWGVTEHDEHAQGNSDAAVIESIHLLSGAGAADPENDTLSVEAGSVKIDNGDGTYSDLPAFLTVDSAGNLAIDTNSAGFDALYKNSALNLDIVYRITDGTNTIDNRVDLAITGTADQFTNQTSTSGTNITGFDTTTWDGSFNFALADAPAGAFDFTGTAAITVTGDIDGVAQQETVTVTFEGGDSATLGATTDGNKEFGKPNYQSGGYADTDSADFTSADSVISGAYDSTTLGGADGIDHLGSVQVTVTSYYYWM